MSKKARVKRINKIGRIYCPAGIIDCIQEYTRESWARDGDIVPKIFSILEAELTMGSDEQKKYSYFDTAIGKGYISEFLSRKKELPKAMKQNLDEKSFDDLVESVEYGLNQIISEVLPLIGDRESVCASINELFTLSKEQISDKSIRILIEESFEECKESEFNENTCQFISLNLSYVAKYIPNVMSSSSAENTIAESEVVDNFEEDFIQSYTIETDSTDEIKVEEEFVQRKTFTAENPADYPVFNSIVDNPIWGDERYFVKINDPITDSFKNEVQVEVGKEYEVMIFFHNNAKSEYNTDETQSGIAKNCRLSISQPSGLIANSKTAITGIISSDNTKPKSITARAYVIASANVSIRYVPGSAKIGTNRMKNQPVPTNLFSEKGVLLGYDKLNGLVPGCTQYFGYIYYRIKIDKPAFDISTQVAITDSNYFKNSLECKLGAFVDTMISYSNTGTTMQKDVVIKNDLPKGLEYVEGSTILVNYGLPRGKILSDNLITKGVNIGTYGPNMQAMVLFKAKITTEAGLFHLVHGENRLKNIAKVITANGTKESSSFVILKP